MVGIAGNSAVQVRWIWQKLGQSFKSCRLVLLEMPWRPEVAHLQQMLKELEAERNRMQQQLRRLDAAIEALRNVNHTGRLAGPTIRRPRNMRRKLSVAARSRIAAAQRARWAKLRAQQKKAA